MSRLTSKTAIFLSRLSEYLLQSSASFCLLAIASLAVSSCALMRPYLAAFLAASRFQSTSSSEVVMHGDSDRARWFADWGVRRRKLCLC